MGPYLYHCISRVIPLVLVISSLSQLNLLRVIGIIGKALMIVNNKNYIENFLLEY